ncbi:MAG: energy transducer TonB [Sphingobium sp.]
MNVQNHPARHKSSHEEGALLPGTVVMMSFYYSRASRGMVDRAAPEASGPEHLSSTRYCDQPMDWRTRALGLGGTLGIMALVLGSALLTWRAVSPSAVLPALAVFDMSPPAAPSEPEVAVPEGPAQVEQAEQRPQKEEQPELPEIIIPRSSPVAVAMPPPVERVTSAEPVSETTAPPSLLAPSADRVSNDDEMTWEALLMAHLEKHRRYPAAARARREQGTVHVRFRMNRAGQVLWSRIERSSGSLTLDRAALDTFRRAQPLPAIPDDKPDELEIALPVEFFTR